MHCRTLPSLGRQSEWRERWWIEERRLTRRDLPEKVKRTSWVYRMWGGQVRSRVLCLSCKHPSDTFDSFLDLSLDVPARAKTVADLLKQFIHVDKLDGDNKYNCEK